MFIINQVDIQWIFDTCNITVPKYFLSQPIHVFEKKKSSQIRTKFNIRDIDLTVVKVY